MILDQREILVVDVCLMALRQVAEGVSICKLEMCVEGSGIRVQASSSTDDNLINGVFHGLLGMQQPLNIGGTIWLHGWEHYISAISKMGKIVDFRCIPGAG